MFTPEQENKAKELLTADWGTFILLARLLAWRSAKPEAELEERPRGITQAVRDLNEGKGRKVSRQVVYRALPQIEAHGFDHGFKVRSRSTVKDEPQQESKDDAGH